MLFLLLLTSVTVAFAVDAEVQAAKVEKTEELKADESKYDDDRHSFSDGLELMRHREHRLNAERHRILSGNEHSYRNDHPALRGLDHDLPGPVILRTPDPLPHQGHPNIEAQNKIIADVYSPDYAQPTWVLDYRYLKTGGRDYTRGPGGQILILPKGVRSKEHKEFPDYDAYLEHLRLSRLSERQDRHGYRDHHDEHRGDRWQHHHEDEYGHGQTTWRKYG